MGKVRKYLVERSKIEKKQKMSITQDNLLEKWNSLVGPPVQEGSETEYESEDFF